MTEQQTRKIYIQTWGCQMNVADSERMHTLMSGKHFVPTASPDDADVIVLNTCHIREKARHKVVSRLGELRPLKEQNPDLVLAVSGCVAQAESVKLKSEVPFLDLIFGPDQIEKLPELVETVWQRNAQLPIPAGFSTARETIVDAQFTKEGYTISLEDAPPWMHPERTEVSRYVNIIKGCNNFCTFCVVPHTRGREKSRSAEEVLAEVQYFVEHGVKEVVLLGQNVNSYGLDFLERQPSLHELQEMPLPFAQLLYKIAQETAVERIRFTTSNPHDFTPQLASAFRDLPKLASSFHLPVQSGSDAVLAKMNRQYTRAEYFERVGWIRSARPDVAFSTDIIVGFPGESEQDFADTLSLVEEMQYAFIYAFKYSRRPGTAAARFKNSVPEDVADQRLQRLLNLQDAITTRLNKAEIGQRRHVLILYKNRKEDHSWYGRTYQGRLVKVLTARPVSGKILDVTITEANKTALVGVPC
jgi:tRNA-2-methylthio-N6-dimethylallyladenosine synthase